mgnify:CR=1 FL=1
MYKRQTEQTAPAKKKDKFADAIQKATPHDGVFKAWVTPKNELLLEITPKNLDNLYLLANRVSETSNSSNFTAGEMLGDPFMFCLSADTSNVYMHTVQTYDKVKEDDAIAASFKRNFNNPILKTFKIKASPFCNGRQKPHNNISIAPATRQKVKGITNKLVNRK